MRILRGLTSASLGCGCFVGVYETYDGRTIAIIDERGPGCTDPRHREGARLGPAPGGEVAALTSTRMMHATGRR
jgi:hypothetical protein